MWLEEIDILSKPSPKSSSFSPLHLTMDIVTQGDLKAIDDCARAKDRRNPVLESRHYQN